MPIRKRKRSSSRVSRRTKSRPSPKFSYRSMRGKSYRKSGSRDTHNYSRYALRTANLELSALTLDRGEKFSFDQLINYSEFASLYDRYRITRVVVYLQLVTNPDSNSYTNQTSTSQQANWYPKVWYVPDYDDTVTPSLEILKQYTNVKCKVLQPNKRIRISLRPANLMEAYKTDTTTGVCPKWNQWIDMSHVDVPYYGLKYCFDANGLTVGTTYPFKISIEQKYYFTCKGVR